MLGEDNWYIVSGSGLAAVLIAIAAAKFRSAKAVALTCFVSALLFAIALGALDFDSTIENQLTLISISVPGFLLSSIAAAVTHFAAPAKLRSRLIVVALTALGLLNCVWLIYIDRTVASVLSSSKTYLEKLHCPQKTTQTACLDR